MAWVLIVIAGFFETGFAVLLKQSESFTKPWPTVGFAVCAIISLVSAAFMPDYTGQDITAEYDA